MRESSISSPSPSPSRDASSVAADSTSSSPIPPLIDASSESRGGRVGAAFASLAANALPPLEERHGAYRLRFATTEADRDSVFALRFEVFALELGEALPGAFHLRRDVDPFDDVCHHLIVDEIETGRLVGTYRLATPAMARAGRGFYSATEFDLSALPAELLESSVELGRACVAREHRNKSVLFLLWRGLGGYLLWNDLRSFFGCSSLTSRDPREGVTLHARLAREGRISDRFRVAPLPGFECVGEPLPRTIELPKLFSIYLRHGAVVLGPPALDREFGTIDFLTLLEARSMGGKLFDLFTHGLPRRRMANRGAR